jgi:thiazole synthase ThiGH ThiG subunit
MTGTITSGRRLAGFGTAAAMSILMTAVVLHPTAAHAAEDPVGLGTAADYSVLAGSTVTNTGPSDLGQSLGVHPGSTNPGFLRASSRRDPPR